MLDRNPVLLEHLLLYHHQIFPTMNYHQFFLQLLLILGFDLVQNGLDLSYNKLHKQYTMCDQSQFDTLPINSPKLCLVKLLFNYNYSINYIKPLIVYQLVSLTRSNLFKVQKSYLDFLKFIIRVSVEAVLQLLSS